MRRFLILLLAVAVVAGCAITPRQLIYEPVSSLEFNRPPKNLANVVVYTKGAILPTRAYRGLGIIAVSEEGQDFWGGVRKLTPEECFNFLRREAARRGGDAVIEVRYSSQEEDVEYYGGSGAWNNEGGRVESGGFKGKVRLGGYFGIVIAWD